MHVYFSVPDACDSSWVCTHLHCFPSPGPSGNRRIHLVIENNRTGRVTKMTLFLASWFGPTHWRDIWCQISEKKRYRNTKDVLVLSTLPIICTYVTAGIIIRFLKLSNINLCLLWLKQQCWFIVIWTPLLCVLSCFTFVCVHAESYGRVA